MFSHKLNYKIINFTALMLLFYMGFSNIELWLKILTSIFKILLPFLISFSIAYSLYPLVLTLTKKRLKKNLANIIVVIGISLFFIALVVITLPLIYEQLVLFSRYIISVLNNIGIKFNINLGGVELKLQDYLNTLINNLSTIISDGALTIVNKSITFIGNFIIGYISGIYFLWDMENIRLKIKKMGLKISLKCYEYLKCLDSEIGNYIKGLAITMLIQLFEYAILFLIVGHPNWLLLGILASVTTVIPYFGGIVTNIIGIVVASTISPTVLLGTMIICIVFPLIDSYIVSPKIYGKTNDINPFLSILLISIGGSIFGVIGIIIILPCYIFLKTTYNFFFKNIKKLTTDYL